MYRAALLALLALPLAGRADDSPERLLSPGSQAYFRWDGVKAHRDAYDKSAFGQMLAGDAGRGFQVVLDQAPGFFGAQLVGEPLLKGASPEQLTRLNADLRHASKLPNVLADHGFAVGVEIRPPNLGLGSLLSKVTSGGGAADFVIPEVTLTVVIPGGAEKADVLFSAFRLIANQGNLGVKESDRMGRKVAEATRPQVPVRLAWWVEGKHAVAVISTVAVDGMLQRISKPGDGLAGHSLFKKLREFKEFETVARGFIDTGALLAAAKPLATAFAPQVWPKLEQLGVTSIKSAVFHSGFEGAASRMVAEVDMSGPRAGFAKVLGGAPLKSADLPAMPDDLSRWTLVRIDLPVMYESLIALAEAVGAPVDDDEVRRLLGDKKGPSDAEKAAARREVLARRMDVQFGMNVRAELLPVLGDRLLTYNSASEGFFNFGQVAALSLKDPGGARKTIEQFVRGVETLIGATFKVRRKQYHGCEVRELYLGNAGFLVPTYTICGDWVVFSLMPQSVYAYVGRAAGKVPAWKPDAATAAAMAKLPSDAIMLQYTDPRASFKQVLSIAPFIVSAATRDFGNEGVDTSVDVGLIPNAAEASRSLFPNVAAFRDDGKTFRWETRDSFRIPLEIVGPEIFVLVLSMMA